MSKLGTFVLGILLLSGRLCASPDTIDIFGVDEKTKQRIYSSCSAMFEQYLNESKKINLSTAEPSKKEMVHRLRLEERIISKIKKIDNFAVVKLSVVYYPDDKKAFGIVDIVKTTDADRIPGKNRTRSRTKIKPSNQVKNLVKIWKDYEVKYMTLIRENKFDFSSTTCPTLHCIWGFDKEDLKTTLPKLQKGVAQNKQELFNIIKNSADENERGDAIFILANDNHPQELVDFLITLTDDPSDLVRNNVMRVLGSIVSKNKVENITLERIIQALNYPYVTDRNKAAYVLLGIVNSDPETHAQVINQGGNTLLELLKLQQPNNHDFAYHILKKLSGQRYDERDYISWSKWIKTHQS